MIETRPNELIHYGVPGMKWGVRKQKSHLSKSRVATRKAKEYEDLAKDAKSVGDTRYANKFSKKAQKYKTSAEKHSSLAKKFDPDTPVGKLEAYKHNKRVKTAIGVTAAAIGGYAAAVAIATAYHRTKKTKRYKDYRRRKVEMKITDMLLGKNKFPQWYKTWYKIMD